MFIVRAGTPYSPTSGQLRLSFMRLVDVYIHLIRWLHIIRADILRVAWYFLEPEGARKNRSNEQNVYAYYM